MPPECHCNSSQRMRCCTNLCGGICSLKVGATTVLLVWQATWLIVKRVYCSGVKSVSLLKTEAASVHTVQLISAIHSAAEAAPTPGLANQHL